MMRNESTGSRGRKIPLAFDWACMAVLFFVAALFLPGCGGSVWPERSPVTVENVRIDTVRFLPPGGRFILQDSLVRIQLKGINIGYACSEILELKLEDAPSGTPPAFKPRSRIRLPAVPDCAVDSNAVQDSILTRIFGAGTGIVRIANSSGKPMDSAQVVRGTLHSDSLEGVVGITRTLTKRPWTFQDSLGSLSRTVSGDSLSSCTFLNKAEFSAVKDTVKVRLSYVTLDSAASPDSCRGPLHRDTVPAIQVSR
ncbi:MAG: hypothetical protein M3Y08_00275 [Fibrobacterota bacterium]|nr:hypothetical protein [Fibrobacterota bacterium]